MAAVALYLPNSHCTTSLFNYSSRKPAEHLTTKRFRPLDIIFFFWGWEIDHLTLFSQSPTFFFFFFFFLIIPPTLLFKRQKLKSIIYFMPEWATTWSKVTSFLPIHRTLSTLSETPAIRYTFSVHSYLLVFCMWVGIGYDTYSTSPHICFTLVDPPI